MGYQAYPEYKNSGVEWLGKVPAHWHVIAIKQLTPVLRGASPRPIQDPKYFDDEGEYSWVRIADVTASHHHLEKTTQRLSTLGKSLSVPLEPGSLFLSIAGSVGKPIISNIKCCIHDGFVYFPHYRHDIEFLYYIFDCGQAFLGLGKLGTQLNLNTDTVGCIKIGLPPIEEQQKIANFLNHKTAQVDRLIEKKQELIEKLQEQRITIISQAVTKGFENNVLMKDSGVKWLGEIPESWGALRLRYCTKFITSGSRGWAEFFTEDGSPFLRITNLDRHSIDLLLSDIQRVSPPENAEGERTKTFAGDVLVSITADLGSVAVIPDDFERSYVSQHIALVRPERERIFSKWLAYSAFSASGKSQLLGAGYGGTKTQLSLGDIKELYIALPPKLELQKELINEVDMRLEKINKIHAATELAISSLQEYRTALITAAVTGQIDVRDWQAPVATEEPEADKEVA